jgi:hypothetical protein
MKQSLFQYHPFFNVYSSIGQCDLLQRTCSTIWWRRHRFYLLTPRSYPDRSLAQFEFFRGKSFRTINELRCLIRCNQLFIRRHRPCSGSAEWQGKVFIYSCIQFRPPLMDPPSQYLTAWARVTLPHQNALDTELGKKLWEWCEEQVKDV